MLKSFPRGGIHPPDNKFSKDSKIEILPIPQTVNIPLAQHLGAPAKPLVKKGDKVKVGTLIGESSGFISANIHSSVSGTVTTVGPVLDSSGYLKEAVTIGVEGDEWEESIDKSIDLIREITLSKEEIIKRLKDSGIVGMGGATFPAHVKLMVPDGKKAEILVINGVECEPYLTADHRIMIEKSDELMTGITILMIGLGVKRAIVGIENNKEDAIKKLTELAKEYTGIEIEPLQVKYPQGGEKQLIHALLDKHVPDGGLPIDVGVVVNNVGTVYAVYEAVQKNKPLIERVVTVTGKSLTNPCNLMVRIGTSVSDLIDKAGGLPEDTGKILNGGPMMGKSLTSIDVPVVKGTSGILVLRESESKREVEGSCIRCGRCVTVCSLYAEPYLMSQAVKKRNWELAENVHVMGCCECGTCQFACPANIPLLDYIRLGKIKVGQIIRSRKS